MSWHNRDCSIPDLDWRDGYPTCIRCNSSASSIANGAAETPPPPAPPPSLKRSQLRCSWPPHVKYSRRLIDKDGNDLTKFLVKNIDGWNIDATELHDDRASLQELIDASPRMDRSGKASELSRTCSNATNNDISNELSEAKHNKPFSRLSVRDIFRLLVNIFRLLVDIFCLLVNIFYLRANISRLRVNIFRLCFNTCHLGLDDQTKRSDRIHKRLCGSDDFRLLRLYGSVSSNDPIHCSLEVAQLSDPDVPLYEALSYTWANIDGDKRNCMPIYIGSHFDLLLVTKNCQSALRRLRKGTDRLLWIDAICINQNDSIERSAQVNCMAKIYSIASRVIIYLGEESNESAEELTTVTSRAQTSAIRRDTALLVKLAKRPYFKRLWIIQEVGLATRAIVVYGGLMIHWTDLSSALQLCGAAPEWIKHFTEPAHRRHEAPPVFKLLQDTKDALCVDPRDRIFGIIGLADAAERELLPTDYSLSAQQLYTGLAAYWIQKKSDRSFLNLASNQRKIIRGLPSWVPDWTNIETQESDAMMPELHVGSCQEAFPELLWRHDGRREAKRCLLRDLMEFRSPLCNQDKFPFSTPIQLTARALLLYAIPLFRVSHSELKVDGVASGTRITQWHMHHNSKLFDQEDELEIFAIPTWCTAVLLKKHSAGVFSFQSCISIFLCRLDKPREVENVSKRVYPGIHRTATHMVAFWGHSILNLHVSSNLAFQDSAGRKQAHLASVFPDLPGLRDAEESLREKYQRSDQIGFNSDQFKATDLMRTSMINAIDPEDLVWRSPIPSNFYAGLLFTIPSVSQGFVEKNLAFRENIEEQIGAWYLSVAHLRSQLQEQGPFSDAFRDPNTVPFAWSIPKENGDLLLESLGLYNDLEGMERNLHIFLFLQKAYSLISRATLDENLPWDYNRDRFWMCMVSFDLIVRMRLLFSELQSYFLVEHSMRSSIANPKEIVIV